MFRALGSLLLVGACAALLSAAEPSPSDLPAEETPAFEPVSREAIDEAIGRGVAYLLKDQNADGSWGSAERTKGLNIYAPVPGAHHAFRSAVTALCVSAICEVGGDDPKVAEALDRAEKWMLEHLPKLRRANGDALYNVWGHAYAIEAFVHLHQRHSGDPERQAELKRQIAQQVDLLDRYETVNGGWGYYDFNAQTKKPSGDPNSFTTATALIALDKARSVGVEVPERLFERGLAVIRRQMKPDQSYIYSENLKYAPQHPVNLPGGSLGRSQVCNYTLRLFKDEKITDEILETWLRKLFTKNHWLDMGRKRPIPHESWFAVAGYFFYYGHYYSAFCIESLPEAKRPELQHRLARVLVGLQEKDGSWWDYPLYNYHQQYGTAFALMTLHRCKVDE